MWFNLAPTSSTDYISFGKPDQQVTYPQENWIFQAVGQPQEDYHCLQHPLITDIWLPLKKKKMFSIFFSDCRQQLVVEYYLHWTTTFEISFSGSSDKPRQLIVEYYVHWTTMFETSFSGSSDTNHDSLL